MAIPFASSNVVRVAILYRFLRRTANKIGGALGNTHELRSQIQLRPLSHISLQKTRKKDWQHEWLGLHSIAGSFNQNS